MAIPSFTLLDVAALATFLVCWLGFVLVVDRLARNRRSLMSRVRDYRRRWIAQVCARDNHTADATLLSNLLRGALFFASTTVFILGGLLALLGTAPKVAEMVSGLEIGASADVKLAEIKALIMILVFVYAFFKFTWSAWQYNVLSIMVGAVPGSAAPGEERTRFLESASRIAALAGESYNNGIRAYYFAIPLMTWLVSPALFLIATLTVAIVLYRREFHSPTLAALGGRDTED